MERRLVLIADADPAIRRYVAAVLEKDGFQTVQAFNGRQAVELVRALSTELVVVVVDLDTPGIDGLSVARTVRSVYPQIGVVLIAAAPPQGLEPIERGIAIIEKPFSRETLLGALATMIMPRKCPGSEARRSNENKENCG